MPQWREPVDRRVALHLPLGLGRRDPNSATALAARYRAPNLRGVGAAEKDGHSRNNCPEFKAILAKNNGRVPKDYAGAYERSLKSTAKPVAHVRAAPDAPGLNEHTETIPIWPLLPMPTPIKNRYGDLDDGDESDDWATEDEEDADEIEEANSADEEDSSGKPTPSSEQEEAKSEGFEVI